MSDNTGSSSKILDQASGVLEKAYDDLAHPSAKSIGNSLSLIPRTIGIWLSKWEKWVINGEESIKLTAEAVREKASAIPEEKLTEPEPYVAVPAIQQLSYCYDSEELRKMYANLLVSSMNADTKYQVHPAYVDIIKQLSPIEAVIIRKMKEADRPLPIISLQLRFDDNSFRELITDYTPFFNEIGVNRQEVNRYLQNIARLSIISIRYDQKVKPDSAYGIFDNDPYVAKEKGLFSFPNSTFKTVHGLIELTQFGQNFCEICID